MPFGLVPQLLYDQQGFGVFGAGTGGVPPLFLFRVSPRENPPLGEYQIRPQGAQSTYVLWPNPNDARAEIIPDPAQFTVSGATYALVGAGTAKDLSEIYVRISGSPTATALNALTIDLSVSGVDPLAFADATSAVDADDATIRVYTWTGPFADRWRGGQYFPVQIDGPKPYVEYPNALDARDTIDPDPASFELDGNTYAVAYIGVKKDLSEAKVTISGNPAANAFDAVSIDWGLPGIGTLEFSDATSTLSGGNRTYTWAGPFTAAWVSGETYRLRLDQAEVE